jgi:hypothetical protein
MMPDVIVTQRDRLREKVADLGAAAVRPLTMRGVPREVQLPGWTGPTFFTSELGHGRLQTLDVFAPAIPEALGVHGWVLGSVREPMSSRAEDASAVFVMERGTGRVVLVDLEQGQRPTFVDSSAGLFLDAIDVFLQWWQAGAGRNAELRRIREDLLRLDPPAMASPVHYWPQWLDDLRDL